MDTKLRETIERNNKKKRAKNISVPVLVPESTSPKADDPKKPPQVISIICFKAGERV